MIFSEEPHEEKRNTWTGIVSVLFFTRTIILSSLDAIARSSEIPWSVQRRKSTRENIYKSLYIVEEEKNEWRIRDNGGQIEERGVDKKGERVES